MATQVQLRRGTTAQHSSFTGAAGELTVDTDKKTAVVHDGSTAGGVPLLRENGAQNAVTTGTSTAASFIPTSSTVPTNGVYLPAANSVGISTNGAGRLFVDDLGRVGVGAAAVAGVNFNVQGSTPIFRVTGASATNPTFQLSAAGVTSWSQVVDAGNSSFYISRDGTERLRITAAGLVGVGTSAPGSALDVAGEIRIYPTSGTANLRFGSGGAEKGKVAIDSSSNYTVETAGSERLRVTSAGLMGVGTSSPGARLESYTAGTVNLRLNGSLVGGNTVDFYNFIPAVANDGFAIQLGGTTRAVIDSSGRVGIGVSAPGYTLDVAGTINANATFRASNGTHIGLFGSEAFAAGVVGIGSGSNHPLVFGTNATERMRIRNDGAVWIGTTTGTINTTNYGTAIGFGAAGAFDTSRNVNGASAVASIFGNAGVAYVMGDGDLENTNNRYTGISDIKFKQNIVDASSQWSDIKQIRVRKYELIASPDRQHIGLIAQELEQICPGLVVEREDRDGESYKSVAYSVLYMKAVKALQEAMERIETLEAKVAALEAA